MLSLIRLLNVLNIGYSSIFFVVFVFSHHGKKADVVRTNIRIKREKRNEHFQKKTTLFFFFWYFGYAFWSSRDFPFIVAIFWKPKVCQKTFP